VAVVLLFVGAGAAETDTAGNCSGLSPKGIAEPAMEVATGDDLPVALGAGLTAPSSFLLSLKGAAGCAAEVAAGAASAAVEIKAEPLTKGAAEVAAKVFDGEPSFLLIAA
jgi:hypothetical protein